MCCILISTMKNNQLDISPNSTIEYMITAVSKIFITVEYRREYDDKLYSHSDVNNLICVEYSRKHKYLYRYLTVVVSNHQSQS